MFTQFWWLIFPVSGIALGFFRIWLKHRRRIEELELIKIYIANGKEPPAELLQGSTDEQASPAQTEVKQWKHLSTFSALTIGFAAAYVLAPDGGRHPVPFLITAIIMGAFALGAVVSIWAQRRIAARDRQ